jgi:LysR family transcriptional regulator, glycine cleavage system transcriptional activator
MYSYLNSLPSLSTLRAFEAVSRHLDFDQASKELGISPHTIINEINSLEMELNTHLFYRYLDAISLTEHGKYYADKVREAFNTIVEATDSIHPRSTHITLSAPPTFAAKWLIPKLHTFTSKNSNINLQILAMGELCNFDTDLVDMAIRYGTPPFDENLSYELFIKDDFISVVSPKLVKLYGKPDENDHFESYTLLHDLLKLWPDYLDLIQLKKNKESNNVYFNQTSLAIDAALSGQGIAICHSFFVKNEIETKQLVHAFPEKLIRESGFYIVFPKSSLNNENIKKIRDWLISQT